MKNPWVVIGVIVAVLLAGAIWYSSVAADQNNEGVVIKDNITGNPDSPVKLVEYSDFQCPACATFQAVLADVMSEYGDKVSLEYKHFPLPIHPLAVPAAVAAEAAGQQGKFFEFHDLLFKNQATWTQSATPNAFFVQYAEELGLDIPTFKRHMNAKLLRDKVLTEKTEALAAGLTGTPTFFLNGEKMQFDTYQAFFNQIVMAVDPEALTATSTEGTTTAGQGGRVKFGI